jgi:hypothetical protein
MVMGYPSRHVRIMAVLVYILALVLVTTTLAAPVDRLLKRRIKSSIDLGLRYLRFKQEPSGSWNNYPGITALVVRAFMKSPRHYTEADGPFVRMALAYLAGLAKPDGAIYDHDLPNYNTSVALMALQVSGNPKYQPLVKRARDFLIQSQLDESKGFAPSHPFYGAIGRGAKQSGQQPDLDNLGFALTALHTAHLAADHPVWQKALSFIQRSQNRNASNDQPWAGNDGGFVFRPGFSYAGDTTSYASMTYVGLLSFLHAGIDKQDTRVQAAFDWLRRHYSMEENPGLGQQALYHYYYFIANALTAYGEPIVIDAANQPHHWQRDLAEKLLLKQTFDGYWVNEVPLWWENNPILATAFAILALEQVYNHSDTR